MGNCLSPLHNHIPLENDPAKYLRDDEVRWVQLQPFLLRRGYRLRARYQPNWQPSWHSKSLFSRPIRWFCEDDATPQYMGMIDAVRISDGAKVFIKQFSTTRPELRLLQMLNTPKMRADSRNKTVPIFDLFPAPDTDEVAFAVMPQLTEFLLIPFQFVDEVFDAFAQYINTISFLHEHHIAHMDVCCGNLMMDASKIVPRGFHPSLPKRTEKDITEFIKYKSRRKTGPTDYYIIDFGISQDLSPTSGQFGRKFFPRWGQDKTIPEWKDIYTRHNPFKVDICQLGNVFKRILTHYNGLAVLEPLVNSMTASDPNNRPEAAEASKQLHELRASLTEIELSRRIFYKVASKHTRRRLVRGNSPPELLSCYELLFPEWYTPTKLSEKTGTSES